MCFYEPVTASHPLALLLQVFSSSSSLSFDLVLSKCLTEECHCDVETHEQSAFCVVCLHEYVEYVNMVRWCFLWLYSVTVICSVHSTLQGNYMRMQMYVWALGERVG